jgi:bifunctional ADP-heptose synthase (sugar kinase/adenylyltransferase)
MKLGLDVEFTSQGETVVALLANTVCAQSRPSDAFGVAVAEARLVNGVRGTRGEAVLAIAEIRRMLSDRPAVELD